MIAAPRNHRCDQECMKLCRNFHHLVPPNVRSEPTRLWLTHYFSSLGTTRGDFRVGSNPWFEAFFLLFNERKAAAINRLMNPITKPIRIAKAIKMVTGLSSFLTENATWIRNSRNAIFTTTERNDNTPVLQFLLFNIFQLILSFEQWDRWKFSIYPPYIFACVNHSLWSLFSFRKLSRFAGPSMRILNG